jgi:putative CocE/NonD family hydrolase
MDRGTLQGHTRSNAVSVDLRLPRTMRACTRGIVSLRKIVAVATALFAIAAGADPKNATGDHSASAIAKPSDPDAPVKPFWARRETGYLKTADGTLLRYSVLLPAAKGRFPVALIYSGYDTGSIGGAAYLGNDVTFSADLDETLVRSGYAVMGVNARATACSEGERFSFLGPKYGEDGRDAIEFAAVQPWSNGNVGMYGWSWGGMSQLATASNRPPHLKAIAPGMVLGDPRLDNIAPGGVTAYSMPSGWREFLFSRWAAAKTSAEAEHDARCLAQLQRNFATEERSSFAREAMQHPLRDAWTEEIRLSARTHLIDVPVLSMESFQDEATSTRGDYYQETLDPRRTWLLQSNGPHDLYESLQYRTMLVAFLDRFVKGAQNDFDRRPHLTVWIDSRTSATGPHAYMEAATPGWLFTNPDLFPTTQPVAFALTQGGRLVADDHGDGAADAYAYPLPGPAVDARPDADVWEPLSPGWERSSLVYTTAPLDRDVLAYGPASADLWLSSTAPDADVQVTVTAVKPDGQEMFLQRGWLRLSNRAIDEARSKPTRPVIVDRPESIRPLRPDEPVLARVEINKFATVFRRGCRIRIWIDTPSPTGLYQFNYVPLPAPNRLWHDAAHPSRFVIGELQGIEMPPDVSTCGAVMKQPCRADPVNAPH